MRHKIGDIVYLADCGNKQVEVLCPICFGTRKVLLTLGNGDVVQLPCEYCGKGYEGPRGIVSEYQYVCGYKEFHITGVNITMLADREIVEYHSGSDNSYFVAKEEEAFDTKEEATFAAYKLKEKLDEEQATRSDNIKKNTNRNYSWNAGYHMKQVKEAQKNIEYHTKMALLCKAKAKHGVTE